MENFKAQISQATNQFLGEIVDLARRHTGAVFSSAFASLGTLETGRPRSAERRSDTAGVRADRLTSAGRRYSAKRDPADLDRLAAKFAQFVRVSPGLRIEQVNKQLGTKTSELALPIRKLVAGGVVATQGEKRSTTYHPGKNFESWDGRLGGSPQKLRAGRVAGRSSRRPSKGLAGKARHRVAKPSTSKSRSRSRSRPARSARTRSQEAAPAASE
jgi:hypothetical protein